MTTSHVTEEETRNDSDFCSFQFLLCNSGIQDRRSERALRMDCHPIPIKTVLVLGLPKIQSKNSWWKDVGSLPVGARVAAPPILWHGWPCASVHCRRVSKRLHFVWFSFGLQLSHQQGILGCVVLKAMSDNDRHCLGDYSPKVSCITSATSFPCWVIAGRRTKEHNGASWNLPAVELPRQTSRQAAIHTPTTEPCQGKGGVNHLSAIR